MRKRNIALGVLVSSALLLACNKQQAANDVGFEPSNVTDISFALKANYANEADFVLSRFASTRATDTMVRNYARQMTTFSSDRRNAITQAALQARLTTTVMDSSRFLRDRYELGFFSGRRFDSVFIRKRALAMQQIIVEYQEQISKGASPSLRGFAAAQLPILQGLKVRVDSIARRF